MKSLLSRNYVTNIFGTVGQQAFTEQLNEIKPKASYQSEKCVWKTKYSEKCKYMCLQNQEI